MTQKFYCINFYCRLLSQLPVVCSSRVFLDPAQDIVEPGKGVGTVRYPVGLSREVQEPGLDASALEGSEGSDALGL